MPQILLSLASKQIWPQVLAVAHLKPDCLILFHSDHDTESRRPAQRLKEFFEKTGLVRSENVRLEQIPHNDFDSIGQNWAARNNVKAFYLERGNAMTWFEPGMDQTIHVRSDILNPNITDEYDPVALLCCQLDASALERKGQSLILNEKGRKMQGKDFQKLLRSQEDMRPFLCALGSADPAPKSGDKLEFKTAATLLGLGIKQVVRSLRLKAQSQEQHRNLLPHSEIDLLFIHGGRLWLVDVKDVAPEESLVNKLDKLIQPRASTQAAEVKNLMQQIAKKLMLGQNQTIKEDLIAARETGGLLGQVVCIRKSELREEVLQYARNNGVEVVSKDRMWEEFEALLFPNRPAGPSQLADLEARFRKG